MGQRMCIHLTGVPPSALHQELELLTKSQFTPICIECLLPLLLPRPRAHLILQTGASFSYSEKKERTKKEPICQNPLNELLQSLSQGTDDLPG